jgi:hypothetical protein
MGITDGLVSFKPMRVNLSRLIAITDLPIDAVDQEAADDF